MDNYHLVERLGQGSFAIVWKARRKSDNRLVAVKQLKQAPATWEECKRLNEIRAAALVRGPHIISMLEAVRHGSELFLVFEYADSDLYRCLGPCERRRFEEPQVRWVMRQLFSALAACHAAGLVHCDVKPENLLLFARLGPCGEPVLKLCDLGQATPTGEVGSYVGTRWYRSSELLLGVERNGPEIDLWAAGCLFAELILLRPPFPGTDTRDMLFRICSALGAPDDGYALSERLMQASGLRFAPCAAEGPLWFELTSSGASSAAVEIVRGLLRYDQGKRLPASRALSSTFFQNGNLEVPLVPPEKDIGRHRNPEGLTRSRDEAKAVSKKLFATSNARGMPSGFGTFSSGAGHASGSGLGGLGLAGSVLDVGTVGPSSAVGLSSSASSPSLSSSSPPERQSLQSSGANRSQAGYFEQGTASSSSSQAVSWRDETTSLPENAMTSLRRQQTERSGLTVASRRLAQAQQRSMALTHGVALGPSRDLTHSVALGAGLPPAPREFHRSSSEANLVTSSTTSSMGMNLKSLGTEKDRPPSTAGPASSSSMPISAPKGAARLATRVGGRDSDCSDLGEEGDDEELANLFWNKVESSRGPSRCGGRESEYRVN